MVGFDPRQGLLVDYEGNTAGALPALCTVELDESRVQQAVALRQRAVLLFENANPTRPLVVGLVQALSSTPLLDKLLEGDLPQQQQGPLEAQVDGRRVVLEAQDELFLKCGEASIALRRNGRVIIRGVQLESRSRGLNRIKGSAVQIN